ncbi:MAG: hypothetical protein Q4G70_04330 [Pseudomonadota bacterium]|nr:hypothetical protein [Pseudomonadota bacterium]
MILLIVISLLGIMAMRNATVGDLTSNALRTNALAQQAAEIGLRYCEEVAIQSVAGRAGDVAEIYRENIDKIIKAKNDSSKLIDIDSAAAAWHNRQNWVEANIVIIVPNGIFRTDGTQGALTQAPRCLIQEFYYNGVNTTPPGYLISARGFANDANFDESSGSVTRGAEMWLQSVLTPKGE